eukprot:TRINITY_DN79297_c0_g1_i1.p1 TRINITY_DN79297_c0_g1~~TRINITY_DN79297_c0_g1_i1.p1  ORF type:complete len:225 (+),score=25.63 TRINITY_DN79297_c0_g1_i1:26-700(+)
MLSFLFKSKGPAQLQRDRVVVLSEKEEAHRQMMDGLAQLAGPGASPDLIGTTRYIMFTVDDLCFIIESGLCQTGAHGMAQLDPPFAKGLIYVVNWTDLEEEGSRLKVSFHLQSYIRGQLEALPLLVYVIHNASGLGLRDGTETVWNTNRWLGLEGKYNLAVKMVKQSHAGDLNKSDLLAGLDDLKELVRMAKPSSVKRRSRLGSFADACSCAGTMCNAEIPLLR